MRQSHTGEPRREARGDQHPGRPLYLCSLLGLDQEWGAANTHILTLGSAEANTGLAMSISYSFVLCMVVVLNFKIFILEIF